jgi:uncharacterized protein with PQ loop repeat
MSLENMMGYAAIFFGVIGSWGLYRQTLKIWKSESAESVSGVWVITFLAMFAAFLIYGSQQGSFPMKFQGWVRVAFSLPVTLGFFYYGTPNKKHLALMFVYVILLAAMDFRPISPWLFILFSYLGVWASFVQAYTIYKNKSRGQVAVELQIIYLAAILCWLVYAIIRHDIPLLTTAIGFTLSYLATVLMWLKYK